MGHSVIATGRRRTKVHKHVFISEVVVIAYELFFETTQYGWS